MLDFISSGNDSETISSLAKHVKAQDHAIDNIYDTLQSLIYIQKKTLKTILQSKRHSNPDEKSVNHFISHETNTHDETRVGHDVITSQAAAAVDEVKTKGDKGNARGKEKQSANLLTTPEKLKYDATRHKEGKESPNGTGSTTSEDKAEKVISAGMAKEANGMELSLAKEIDDQTGHTTNGVSNQGISITYNKPQSILENKMCSHTGDNIARFIQIIMEVCLWNGQ